MKKTIQITLIAAGLLVGSTASAQQKLGHVNTSDLLQAMPEMKVADATIQAYAKGKQATLEQMEAERQKKVLNYQEKAKTISEANRESVEKELATIAKDAQDIMQRLEDMQQKIQEELATKRRDVYQPIIKKLEDAIRAVAKEKGYNYIFDAAQTNMGFSAVVYSDGGDDIAPAVKAKLGISASSAVTPAATPKK